MKRRARIRFLGLTLCLIAACGETPDSPSHASAPASVPKGELNLYNWSDYIAPNTLRDFERETGIHVRYDVFDSNELLEAKLLAGGTGYDLVVPSASFVARQITAGVFQALDKTKLPGMKGLDPAVMKLLAGYDPENRHALPWLWGTTGMGYNRGMITSRMADAPLDSWDLVFKPEVVSRFADCGVALLDTPSEILPLVLRHLGRPVDSQHPEDLAAAEAVLMAIRPHVRYFHSSQYINDLANGGICLVVGWNGDILMARERAREASDPQDIGYSIPREGSLVWVDTIAIPRDSPNLENAYRFLEYILRPEVAAALSNHVHYANAIPASQPLLDQALREDRAVHPAPDTLAALFPNAVHTAAFDRLASRAWARIKRGQ